MTIAWFMVKFHELNMDRLAFERVQNEIATNGLQRITDLRARVAAEKGKIAASKTFKQRFYSIKAAHGMIMFVSWMNITGRIFASDQSGDFMCHTYPGQWCHAAAAAATSCYIACPALESGRKVALVQMCSTVLAVCSILCL
eukprot:GHUV01055659.1.p1 GENE.GHUV01055659.1~~GHUV01055659.1.p1  ORF type:complete len:156 (+),score=42.13 GHUV01055659.1:45-470(+)